MKALFRISVNLMALFITAWLFCESIPALLLTAHYISGTVLYLIVVSVGIIDLVMAVGLFIAVNMLASEMSTS
jgi:hypothetical protein